MNYPAALRSCLLFRVGIFLLGLFTLSQLAAPGAFAVTPAGWTSQDIGSASNGSASASGSNFIVNGAGADIWGYSDSFQFLYLNQKLNGNGYIIAKVSSVQNTDSWAKAGVMIRSDLTPGSANALVSMSPNTAASFQYRDTANGATTGNTGGYPLPVWLKLQRSGNTFTGSASTDGTNYTVIYSATIVMPTQVYFGLAVTGHVNSTTLCQSTFSNISYTGAAVAGSLTGQDIGSATGGTTVANSADSYTINGAGADIWGYSDSFHYGSQQLTGNSIVTVKLTGLQNTNAWAKAGIMIRSDLTAGAANAFMCMSPNTAASFQYRNAAAAATTSTTAGFPMPVYLKLERNGNTFTGWASSDNVSWTQVGTASIAMPSQVYVGLAVTGHVSSSTLAQATFTNFAVAPGASGKTVTIGSGSGYLNYPTAQSTLNLLPGDTLYIAPGSYQGITLGSLNGTLAAPITVTCSPTTVFTTAGSSAVNNYMSNISFVNFVGLRYQNYVGRIMSISGASHDLLFKDFQVTNSADYVFYVYDATKVFNGTKASAFYNFKWLNCVFDGKTDGSVITNTDYSSVSNMKSTLLDFEIAGCTFKNVDTTSPFSVISVEKCFNMQIHDSTFTDIGGTGAFAHVACLTGFGNFKIYNNTFTRVWGDEIRAMPLKLNFTGYNGSDAINRFYNNISADKQKYAMFEVNDVNISQADLDNSGGYLSRTTSEIYYNTFYRSRKVDYVAPLADIYASNVTIKHNLVIEPEIDAAWDPARNYVCQLGTGGLTNIVQDNNLTYQTFALSGLVNTTTFTPSASSPVVNAGTGGTISYILTDRYGNPRYVGGAADVGAVEKQ